MIGKVTVPDIKLREKESLAAPASFSWQPVALPPNDSDDVAFSGSTEYAVLAQVASSYSTADVVREVTGRGWVIERNGGATWRSGDPIPAWGNAAFFSSLSAPDSGNVWFYGEGTAPAAGDTLQLARHPIYPGFIYRMNRVWQAVPAGCPAPPPCPKPASTSLVLPIFGGALLGAAGAMVAEWVWRKWRRRR